MKLTKQFVSDMETYFKDDAAIVLKAVKFAVKKHKGAVRDDGTPYVTHPLQVAEYVRQFKESKNASMLYMAALLHDTLEDTYTSYRELCETFSEEVASIVMELSTAKFALYIKLCERLHNLSTLKGCAKEKQARTVNDTRIILDYLKVVRKLTASQQRVANEIEKMLIELNKKG